MLKLAILGGDPIRVKPFAHWPYHTDLEKEGLIRVLKSGIWGGISENSEVSFFEREYAEYHNSKYCVSVCNGTCALYMALAALDIGVGDEVVVPALAYIASASTISLLGATPVFVDVDPETLCIDVDEVKKALSSKTRAIIAVHLWGNMCDMEALLSIAEEQNLFVIEDCAQAHGANLNGRKAGTFGAMGVFSFASTKNMSCGEGGAIITNDETFWSRLCEIRNHGRVSGKDYLHLRLGWNFRISEFAASILRCQLTRLDNHIQIKNEKAAFLIEELKKTDIKWLSAFSVYQGVNHGYFALALQYRPEHFGNISVETVRKTFCAEGIPVGLRKYIPICDNPIFADTDCPDYCTNKRMNIQHASSISQNIIVMGQPLNSGLLISPIPDIQDVIRAINKLNCEFISLSEYNKKQLHSQ